jgi:hypothetical protein
MSYFCMRFVLSRTYCNLHSNYSATISFCKRSHQGIKSKIHFVIERAYLTAVSNVFLQAFVVNQNQLLLMMTYSIAEVKSFLERRIKPEIVDQMASYVTANNPNLWGTDKPRRFSRDMVILTLYKDLTNFGYDRIADEVDLNYTFLHNSLQHNVQVIREVLKKWGKQYIVVGKLSDWKAASRRANFPSPLSDVNLFIDSTDIPIKHTPCRGPTSDHWSGKIGSPAHRYVMISDAKGKILKVWSGYSPKLYDAHFVALNKDVLEENFHGGTFIADAHFRSARNELEGVTIHTPFFLPSDEGQDEDDEEDKPIIDLTKVKKNYNSKLYKIRSRVERPFANLKKRSNRNNFRGVKAWIS